MNKFNNKNRLEGRERTRGETVLFASRPHFRSPASASFLRFTSLHGVYASYLVLRTQKEVEGNPREFAGIWLGIWNRTSIAKPAK